MEPRFCPLAGSGGKRHGFAVRMITRLFSAALRDVEAQEVEVEVNARSSDKPMVIIIIPADNSIRPLARAGMVSAVGP